MKRRYLYLTQLFEDAGDGAGGNGGTGAGGTGAGDNGGTGDNGSSNGEKKYTDADVDALINKKFAEWQKKQQKAVDEAAKLAGMNAQQKAEHERDELEKKYNELLKQSTVAQLTIQARKMLSDGGVAGIPDDLVAVLVTDDATSTKKNVESFTKLFKDAVQEAVKNANKKPSPKTGTTGGALTKADILKVEDINERQRLINENMDLFRRK